MTPGGNGSPAARAPGPTGAAAWPGPRGEVHRDNCREARLGALSQIYPAVRRILGPDCFRAWAAEFTASRPSSNADLNRDGCELPAWLRSQWRRNRRYGLDYLPDLARLEWTVNEACYAADAPGIETPMRDGQGFRLAPSLGLLASRFPVDQIWRLNVGDATADAVDPVTGRQHLTVWRVGRAVEVERVSKMMFDALRRLRRDSRLEVLVESRLTPGDVTRMVRRGWLVGWQELLA